jgi:hypothetical protein
MLPSSAQIEECTTVVSSSSRSCRASHQGRIRERVSSSCKRPDMIEQAFNTRETLITGRVWESTQVGLARKRPPKNRSPLPRYLLYVVVINMLLYYWVCSSRIHFEERGNTFPGSRASMECKEGNSPRDQLFNPDSIHVYDRMPSRLAEKWMSDILCAPMAIDAIQQACRHRLRYGDLVVSVLRNRLMVVTVV